MKKNLTSEAFIKDFNKEGTFESLYAAHEWLTDNGYSYGSLDVPNPVGILKGEWYISKWRNLTTTQRNQLDGTMIALNGRFREGTVRITLTKNLPA